MKQALKILLLILAVFPLWLTIMAMGSESKSDALKNRINTEFLKVTDRHIQVLEILSRDKEIDTFNFSGQVQVEVANLNAVGTSNLVVKSVDSSGRLSQMIRLPVKLFIEEQVAIATRDIARADTLAHDDFQLVWRDASKIRQAVPRTQDLKGQIARSVIKDGEVIYSNQLQHEAMVARGDRVKVRVVGTGILLTVAGQALEAGSKGQTIKVVNIDSHKEFLGVVTDSKEVELKL